MRSIDDNIEHFRTMSTQGQQQTPSAYNPITPMSYSIPTPPVSPPVFSLNFPAGSIASAQQMAYAAIQQNYISPATAFQAGGAFPGVDPARMTSPNWANFRAAMTPAPPPMSMSAGVTSSFVNPYEAAVSSSMQRQWGMFGDPSRAASNWGTQAANAWGQQWGGGIGAGLGFMAGGPGGAMTGWGLGGTLGGMLGEIPGVGWAASLPYRGAIQQMSLGTRLQAGTQGMISMGGQDIGMGGRGMNAQAALGLGQQFQGLAAGAGGAYNANDLMNLTSSAAEMGLLGAATNTSQIFDTVKKLIDIVGNVAKLTGDPNMRNNLREIANLWQAGFDVSQTPGVIAGMNTAARMAGMTRGQAMEMAGMPGAQIFSQMGMTTGLGQQYGIWGAAQAHMAQGSFSPILGNLLGGEGGQSQRWTQGGAAFLAGGAQMLLPYLATQGKGGDLTLDPDRIQQLLKGGDLSTMIGAGAAKMTPRMMQQLMVQRPELTSMLGQALGGQGGIDLAQLQMIKQIQQTMGGEENMTFEGAATIFAGGDPLQGRMLAKTFQSPAYRKRLDAQLDEMQKRAEFDARQETAKRRAEAPEPVKLSTGGRPAKYEEGGTVFDLLFGSEGQTAKAEKMAIEARRIEDEAKGIVGVYGPGWKLSAAEEQRATELSKTMPVRRPLNVEMRKEAANRWLGEEHWYTKTDKTRQYKEMGIEDVMKSESDFIGALGKYVSPKEWSKRFAEISGSLGANMIAKVETLAKRYAEEQGKDDKPFKWDDFRNRLAAALASEFGGEGKALDYITKNENMLRQIAFKAAESGSPNARRAITNTKDFAGMIDYMDDPKRLQENIDKKKEEVIEAYKKEGIVLNAPGAQEEITALLGAPQDVQAAAVLKSMADSGDESATQKWAELRANNRDIADKVETLMGKTGKAGSAMLKSLAGKAGVGAGIERITSVIEGGLRGQGPAAFMEERASLTAMEQRLTKLKTVTDPTKAGATKISEDMMTQLTTLKALRETLPTGTATEDVTAAAQLTAASALQRAGDTLLDAAKQWGGKEHKETPKTDFNLNYVDYTPGP